MENQLPPPDEKGTDGMMVPAVDVEQIEIRVMDQVGRETYYRLKVTTPMEKVMAAHCDKHGLKRASTRFMVDGRRIGGTDTCKSLELEQGDMIDCTQEQVGGRRT